MGILISPEPKPVPSKLVRNLSVGSRGTRIKFTEVFEVAKFYKVDSLGFAGCVRWWGGEGQDFLGDCA